MIEKRTNKKDSAVSPVVGVMLMLVVTIIIAAVVTMFATGLVTTTEAAPSITIQSSLVNGGHYYDSYLEMKVLSVSEAIPTSDLIITTRWYNETSKTYTVTSTGQHPANWIWNVNKDPVTNAPWGYGNGISDMNSGIPNSDDQKFGNYALIGGTVMYAYPAGQSGGFVLKGSNVDGYGTTAGEYEYSGAYSGAYGTRTQTDGMQSILGDGWEELKSGDKVNIKIVHTPSGMTIYDKDVVVVS